MISSDYKQFNDAVNEIFFDGRFEGAPIYLDYEDNVREALANKLGIPDNEIDKYLGFVIADTLDWSQRNIYLNHKKELMLWHKNDFSSPPTFTALLLTLSLAAENMRGDSHYSANNYYRRLLEVLHLPDEKLDLIRSSGKYTKIFWKALNFWLTENDYAYGRPTARQVNSWTYVSYAISQSLIREGDRQKFHDLFVRYGISPSESLDNQEMMLYLHDWIGTFCTSKWIKRLWQNPDLQERVAGAAVEELEVWGDGTSDHTDRKLQKHLEWLVVISSFPKFRVNLFLSANGLDEQQIGKLSLVCDEPNAISTIAFQNTESIWFSRLAGTNLSYLDPVSKIKIDALLQSHVAIVSEDGQVNFSQSPKPIMPLVKMDGVSYFREVSRVSMHLTHAILCRDNWVDRVTKHLDNYAREGYKLYTGIAYGIPPQWSLIVGVQIVVPIPSDSVINDNLQCLVPFNEGVSLKLIGGLKLISGIWHALAPPDVMASSERGVLDVTLIKEQVERKKTIHKECADSFNPAFLSTLKEEYVGTYSLLAGSGNKKKEIQVAFRSAATPRKLASGQEIELAYALGADVRSLGVFSGVDKAHIEKVSCFLQGMIITGEDCIEEPEFDHRWKQWGAEATSGIEEGVTQDYDTEQVAGQSESCILRGYHVWQCEPQGAQGEMASRVMRCKDCNAVQIAHKPRRKRRGGTRANDYYRPSFVPTFKVEEGETASVDADLIYDALCYMGSSKWRGLESILSTHVDLPWQVPEFARNLVDLGLLDARLETYGGKPVEWSCSPPSLVYSEYNHLAYLSGFRNKQLIEAITRVLDQFGENVSEGHKSMTPSYYGWVINPASIGELSKIVSEIEDPFNRKVTVTSCPAAAMVQGIPAIQKVICDLPEITIDSSSEVEQYDISSGYWKKGSLEQGHAYRTVFAGRRYFYHDENGRSLQGSPELVKLMAARSSKTMLHAYRENTDTFEAVLGSAPPGLYRRALVSLTGRLPQIIDGKHIYEGVPARVADLLLSKLYI